MSSRTVFCSNCGASWTLAADQPSFQCASCGTVQTPPAAAAAVFTPSTDAPAKKPKRQYTRTEKGLVALGIVLAIGFFVSNGFKDSGSSGGSSFESSAYCDDLATFQQHASDISGGIDTPQESIDALAGDENNLRVDSTALLGAEQQAVFNMANDVARMKVGISTGGDITADVDAFKADMASAPSC